MNFKKFITFYLIFFLSQNKSEKFFWSCKYHQKINFYRYSTIFKLRISSISINLTIKVRNKTKSCCISAICNSCKNWKVVGCQVRCIQQSCSLCFKQFNLFISRLIDVVYEQWKSSCGVVVRVSDFGSNDPGSIPGNV